VMTLVELSDSMAVASDALTSAIDELRTAGRRWASAESAYRLARSLALASVDGKNADEREAKAESFDVTLETPDGTEAANLNTWRYRRDLAEAEKTSAYQAVRAGQARVSALQSIAAAHREEARLAGVGPTS
jgi:hypothetical protein